MKVERRSLLFLFGGLLAFLGGFMLGGAGFKSRLKNEHRRRGGAR
jgi:hypothetical protein